MNTHIVNLLFLSVHIYIYIYILQYPNTFKHQFNTSCMYIFMCTYIYTHILNSSSRAWRGHGSSASRPIVYSDHRYRKKQRNQTTQSQNNLNPPQQKRKQNQPKLTKQEGEQRSSKRGSKTRQNKSKPAGWQVMGGPHPWQPCRSIFLGNI